MKLEVTELGPVKRALKIELSPEEVNQEFDQAYAQLNRQVKIPGFRPGKAPLGLLEKRYGKAVEEDLVRRVVPDYYDRAVHQAGIQPVVVEVPPLERIKLKKDAPFSFTATVEIKPTIELRDYRPPNPISLKKDPRTVDDDQVTRTLEALRERHARLEPAPADSRLQSGDYAILDLEAFVDETPLEGAKKAGHVHQVGSNTPVLGIQIDEGLVGKGPSEVLEVVQPYPASHPDTRLAGRSARFRIVVTSVRRKGLPSLDDEFAKDCGPYGSLDELKTHIREELERALNRDIEESYKEQVAKRLVEMHYLELPETLVERELSGIVRQHLDAQQRKRGKGAMEPAQGRQDEIKRLRDEHQAEARHRVKLALILEAIAQKEGIRVEEEDLQNEYRRLADGIRVSVDEVRRMVAAGGEDAVEEFRGRLLAEKTLDFVYRQAMIQG